MAAATHGRGYRVGDVVVVNDSMQRSYRYAISVPLGGGFAPEFKPRFSPKEMLELGVFEGKYCNDCRAELPEDWFEHARIAAQPDPALNCFGVKSRQSLAIWRQKGWIIDPDPRGWFQWYCRYYQGRRLPDEDARQIKRWRAMQRHVRQLQRNCEPGDVGCRKRQRQALLHWAYDSRRL